MNLKFNFNRKEITSEEIASKMNFREVLSNYKILTKPFYKTAWFATTVGIVTIGITSLLILNSSEVNDKNIHPKSVETIDKNSTHYKEDSPCITPPQKDADLAFEVYHVNNDTGGTILHPSGSELKIPAGVFVQNGEKVTGDVEIRYREFRDQADFVVAGIPMTYDSAGTQYHFESAGMIEIRAFKNDQPVELDGEIEVTMKSDYSDPKYNLYALNEDKKNWECIGKDKVSPVNSETNPTNDNSLNFSNTSKQIQNVEKKIEEVKKEIVQIKSTVPEEPKKRNLKNYSLTLDVLADEFPELSVFKNQKFEVDAMTKGFDPKIYDTEWEDIKIQKDSKTGNYKMVLTKNYRDKSFVIYPIYEGNEYIKKKEDFDDAMLVYNAKLDSRLKEEKKLEKELKELRAKTHQRSKELSDEWEGKRKPTYEEVGEPRDESVDPMYVSTSTKTYSNMRLVSGVLNDGAYKYDRKFKVPSLGVFNCDHAVSLPIAKKGKKHVLKFLNKMGEAILLSKIFLIERVRNVMFTYVGEDMQKVKINSDDENMMIGICSNGDIAVFNRTDFTFLDLKQDILELKFQVLDDVKTSDELRKIIQS